MIMVGKILGRKFETTTLYFYPLHLDRISSLQQDKTISAFRYKVKFAIINTIYTQCIVFHVQCKTIQKFYQQQD